MSYQYQTCTYMFYFSKCTQITCSFYKHCVYTHTAPGQREPIGPTPTCFSRPLVKHGDKVPLILFHLSSLTAVIASSKGPPTEMISWRQQTSQLTGYRLRPQLTDDLKHKSVTADQRWVIIYCQKGSFKADFFILYLKKTNSCLT